MLSITAEPPLDCDLRDQMLPEMLDLARRTNCRIEVNVNDTKFWVHPNDHIDEIKAAFDRLYPESRLVFVGLASAWPREKQTGDQP